MSPAPPPVRSTAALPLLPLRRASASAPLLHYLWACLITVGVAAFCRSFTPHAGYVAVGMMFLLAVVVSSLRLSMGPVLTMALLSEIIWHYYFVPPHYSFKIEPFEVILIYGLFLTVAVFMLVNHFLQRKSARRERQSHAMALLSVTQSAAFSRDLDSGMTEALRTINALLGAETALYLRSATPQQASPLSATPHAASAFTPDQGDMEAMLWCYEHRTPAGNGTAHFPGSRATWFPMQTTTSVTGVLGLRLPAGAILDASMSLIAESLACQLALVKEKDEYIQAAQQAETIRTSDKLRRALLDSVSHELKTPLAVMQSATDALLQYPESAKEYGQELQSALRRMRRIVDNLLNMTRLESKAIKPMLDWCEVDELCQGAIDLTGDALSSHRFSMDLPKGMPLVQLDRALMEQALANLLLNAAIHTPAGSQVRLLARLEHGSLKLMVEDDGPGLPPGDPDTLFKQFQRGEQAPTGGSGLGLSIARGFARAHGGEAQAAPRPGGGAIFTLVLPVNVLEECSP